MTPRHTVLPPSSTLPPLKTLDRHSQDQLLALIAGLVEIYCPLSVPVSSALTHPRSAAPKPGHSDSLTVPLVDSGYVSEVNEDEDDDDDDDGGDEETPDCYQKSIKSIRADAFERSFAQRWITGFVTRAEECSAFTSEDAQQSAIEDAYMLIETLSLATTTEEDEDEKDDAEGFRRDFTFETEDCADIRVFLHDKLAGTNSADPDDVGLQSWGASIFFSRLLCGKPERFGLGGPSKCASPRIVELGAGTGLVSLALGALLSKLGQHEATLVATDYHTAVLENLRANVEGNMADHNSVPINVCALDWSAPVWDSPLDKPADIIVATDVVYSPLHAAWVRDCAAQLLAADGTFWLMTAVRQNGKFEGVSETVKAAFSQTSSRQQDGCRQLRIIESERLEKPVGVGRGDESWYELFKIGWQ